MELLSKLWGWFSSDSEKEKSIKREKEGLKRLMDIELAQINTHGTMCQLLIIFLLMIQLLEQL